jgi:predicted aldo/keto reductase-like oxidoreductase
MRYRNFGTLDFQVSALGFGCMRLPTIGDEYENIDEEEATRMVRHAIDQGVNYLDTAYPYHGGNSERFLGRALQDGYRDKVKLATKLPCWLVEGPGDFDRLLDEQLERLQVDYVDFYLLHGLRTSRWVKVRDFGVMDWAEGALADGRFKHLAFSFHGETDLLKEIVDYYDRWSMVQVQYNYMDIENQAGTEGVRYAASKGLAVVVMEGLLGGRLVDPPAQVEELFSSAPVKRTPVEWALHWLWSQPEVSTVLSGMSTMEQVEQNLASADASGVGTLTSAELAIVDQVRAAYEALCPIPCTNCKYCMPCPNGVDIPRNFSVYNMGAMYDRPDDARGGYRFMQTQVERGEFEISPQATSCIQCRECEDKCPQSILISEWMPVIHEVLGEEKPYVCALP